MKKIIKKINEVSDNNLIALFPYGSSVYKNKNPEDYDFIAIFKEIDNKNGEQISFSIEGKNFEITPYSISDFINKRDNHDISILECLLIKHPDVYINENFKDSIYNFKINKEKLREASSQKSSNSYVKAKKKLIIEEDFDIYISLKSLWHSIRILDFSTQIANNNRIDNPDSVNHLFIEINNDYLEFDNDWNKIHLKYKPIYNQFSSKFKESCPKKQKMKP